MNRQLKIALATNKKEITFIHVNYITNCLFFFMNSLNQNISLNAHWSTLSHCFWLEPEQISCIDPIVTSAILHVLSRLFFTKYAEAKINIFDPTHFLFTTAQTEDVLHWKLDTTKDFTCWEENSGGKDETPWSLHPVLLVRTDWLSWTHSDHSMQQWKQQNTIHTPIYSHTIFTLKSTDTHKQTHIHTHPH